MQSIETVRVMPTHPSQGEWVVINATDFDPAVHRLYEEPKPQVEEPKRRGRPPKSGAIDGNR